MPMMVYIDLYNGLIVSECFTITCEFLYVKNQAFNL